MRDTSRSIAGQLVWEGKKKAYGVPSRYQECLARSGYAEEKLTLCAALVKLPIIDHAYPISLLLVENVSMYHIMKN